MLCVWLGGKLYEVMCMGGWKSLNCCLYSKCRLEDSPSVVCISRQAIQMCVDGWKEGRHLEGRMI